MIGWLKQLIKRWRCQHDWKRNIYGDEINLFNARSCWKCTKCDKYHYRPDLNYPEP